MPRPSLLTLVLAVAAVQLVATLPAANALQGAGGLPHVANRAEHVNMNQRMVRKKRAAGDDVPINAVPDPASSTSAPASSSTPVNPGGNGNNNPQSSTSSTNNGGLIGDLSSLLNPGSTSSSTTSTSSTPSSTSTHESSTQQTSSETSSTSSRTTSRSGTVVVVTASVADPAESTSPAKDPNHSTIPKPVTIGLIVAASCVFGAAAIWTIIRKWKFGASRHFEDRLEPINWEPTQASGVDHDPTMAALGRSTSRNGGRPDSFHSGDGHGSTKNMSSVNNDAISMTPDFPPAHDFTAGPSGNLNAGYVDMHRGPSPGPYGAGGYGGRYETPNPYDAYDYNNGYGQQQRRY